MSEKQLLEWVKQIKWLEKSSLHHQKDIENYKVKNSYISYTLQKIKGYFKFQNWLTDKRGLKNFWNHGEWGWIWFYLN